jgi:hypothetical protein
MFWNKSEEIQPSEKPEKAEEVKEQRQFEPYRCWTVYVNYCLRNGTDHSFSVDYENSDYRDKMSHKEAGEAMESDATKKKEEIEALVEANLGQETGWIKLGSNYIANRDLATVSVQLIKSTSGAFDWRD